MADRRPHRTGPHLLCYGCDQFTGDSLWCDVCRRTARVSGCEGPPSCSLCAAGLNAEEAVWLRRRAARDLVGRMRGNRRTAAA